MVINISNTEYEIVQDCAEKSNFRVTTDEREPWDILWVDF